MIKAILFDFDETLVSVRDANYKAYQQALRLYQVESENSEELFDQIWYRNISDRDAINQITSDEHFIMKIQKTFSDYYQEHHLEHIRVFPSIIDLLETLYSKEIKMGIVSLKPRHNGEKELKACKLDKFFDVVIWGDDFSKPKPNIEVCNYALEKLKIDCSNTLICGDGPDDVAMGQIAAIATVGVLWGNTNKELLIKSNPTHLCHKPQEILQIISNQTPYSSL